MAAQTELFQMTLTLRLSENRAGHLESILDGPSGPVAQAFVISALHYGTIQADSMAIRPLDTAEHTELQDDDMVHWTDVRGDLHGAALGTRNRAFNQLCNHFSRNQHPQLGTVKVTGSNTRYAIARKDLMYILTGWSNQQFLLTDVVNFGPAALRSICECFDIVCSVEL